MTDLEQRLHLAVDQISESSTYKSIDWFNPTEEHRMLRQNVAQFSRDRIAPQADEHDTSYTFNHQLFREVGEKGWLAVTLPEKYAGAKTDATHAVVIYEEMAREDPAFTMSCLAHTTLFGLNLSVNGSELLKDRYLPKIASGELRAGIGMTTPNAGSDALSMENTARKVGDRWVLNGEKTYITNCDGDVFLVYARTGSDRYAISQFVVEASFKGVKNERKEEKKFGMHASPTGVLSFDECEVPLENLVGGVNEARTAMLRNLEVERVTLAAISTGVAMECIDQMYNHARTRVQFGRPIFDFQLVGEGHIAKSQAELLSARALLYMAAGKINPSERNDNYANAAKYIASTRGWQIADSALQVLAGQGYCGHKVERLLRDTRLIRIGGGTDEIMLTGLASHIRKFKPTY